MWVDSICSFVPGTPGHGTVEKGSWPIVYSDLLSTVTLKSSAALKSFDTLFPSVFSGFFFLAGVSNMRSLFLSIDLLLK